MAPERDLKKRHGMATVDSGWLVGVDSSQEYPHGSPAFGGMHGNTSFLPEFAVASCDGGFAYCWGAKCLPDPINPEISICKCPFVSSDKGAAIFIIESQCAQQAGNECSYIHNGGAESPALYSIMNDAARLAGTPLKTCSGSTDDALPGSASSSASGGGGDDDGDSSSSDSRIIRSDSILLSMMMTI